MIQSFLFSKIGIGIVVAVLVFGGVVALRVASNASTEDAPEPFVREVSLASVAELSEESAPLSVIGTVRSVSEASLRVQVAGRVTGVFTTLGARIGAGTLIAEIENSTERASVVGAQGQVAGAEATLLKAHSGARTEQKSILETRVVDSQSALRDAEQAAINAIRNAFEESDQAVRTEVDLIFSSPRSTDPQIIVDFSVPQVEQDLELRRVVMERVLNSWDQSLLNLSVNADLEAFLFSAVTNVADVRTFVNLAASGVNSLQSNATLTQAQINTWQAAISSARSSLNTVSSNLATQGTALSSKKSTLLIAEQELEQGVAGDRAEDIAAFEAQLTQALGALQQAQASLEKTRIRSPITGTVNVLLVQRGDFVSAFDSVATVANNQALEIEAFITGGDLPFVQPGNKATISGSLEGVVTRIGSGLDPETKKVQVIVGVLSESDTLVHGDSVQVVINRDRGDVAPENPAVLSVPVSAIKLDADSAFVFIVDKESKARAQKIEIGAVLGERVLITEGISADTIIVQDARGLVDGEVVIVR